MAEGITWLVSGGAAHQVERNVGLTGALFHTHNHTTCNLGALEDSNSGAEFGSQCGVTVYRF